MDISGYIVQPHMEIREVIKKIDLNGQGIVFVCEGRKLMGVISDGDIRRFLLKEGNLRDDVNAIANFNPKYIEKNQRLDIKKYLYDNKITAVPIVDDDKNLLRICFQNGSTIEYDYNLNVPVVIMAGGKGTRLYPYTQILPKPLIPIGDKTITEHIIDKFTSYGCKDISMIVNYKKNFIETYFAENNNPYNIRFVEEEEYLGTGGGLKLLSNINETFFMTNCDILIEENYYDIYQYHKHKNNLITLVCAKKNLDIPYGIVNIDDNNEVVRLDEKPQFSFLTNTGFYIIEPQFLELIPPRTFIHITDVILKCLKEGGKVGTYIIDEESWMDMGKLDELEKMRKRIGE